MNFSVIFYPEGIDQQSRSVPLAYDARMEKNQGTHMKSIDNSLHAFMHITKMEGESRS
jgi:hypothetical protein